MHQWETSNSIENNKGYLMDNKKNNASHRLVGNFLMDWTVIFKFYKVENILTVIRHAWMIYYITSNP